MIYFKFNKRELLSMTQKSEAQLESLRNLLFRSYVSLICIQRL